MSASRITRRQFTKGLAAAGGVLLISRRTPAVDFHMRQYHNQPVEAPLHKRLTQMWDAVKAETQGRVQVEIFPENNHFKDGDPDPLNLLLDGKLEFYTTAGNGLASLVPAANVQATPFAFRNDAQVYKALDGDIGQYLRDELKPKGVYLFPGGCFENGFHQITCATRPIRTAERPPGPEDSRARQCQLSGILEDARRDPLGHEHQQDVRRAEKRPGRSARGSARRR